MQLTKNLTLSLFVDLNTETINNITNEAIRKEMLESPTAQRRRFAEQFAPPPNIMYEIMKTAEKLEPVAEQMIADGYGWDITSGYRCTRLNAAVGGVKGSEHELGKGTDIRWTTPQHSDALIKALINAGYQRIGLGSSFIHAGRATDKPHPAVWQYSNKYKAPAWLMAKAPEYLKLIHDLTTAH